MYPGFHKNNQQHNCFKHW